MNISNGNCPIGSSYSGSAPWDECDVPMCECPDCEGSGIECYYKVDLELEDCEECSAEEYRLLPTEAEAEASGARYCKGETDKCWTCDGTGEVIDDYEPDPDERD